MINIITLNSNKIYTNQLKINGNPIECAINAYYNYCNVNDFSDLKCPCCGNHTLSFYKTYNRNLTYHYNNNVIDTVVAITVCICNHCSKIKDNQKYHAILPDFILPYIIYEASTIMKALSDYYNKMKLKQILERLQIRHKLFYDWLKKLNVYSFSASIILSVDNNVKNIISKIIEYNSIFLNKFYQNYNHPFFLFKLTCVQLCIIP